ncbi:hypothetical protein C9J85_04945 [Haloferax sp. wsp5]|nr:hypothetical protein C9J85_04945 [Haloferax sp. wsp5]
MQRTPPRTDGERRTQSKLVASKTGKPELESESELERRSSPNRIFRRVAGWHTTPVGEGGAVELAVTAANTGPFRTRYLHLRRRKTSTQCRQPRTGRIRDGKIRYTSIIRVSTASAPATEPGLLPSAIRPTWSLRSGTKPVGY